MVTWAKRRQIFFLTIIFLLSLLFVIFVIYPYFDKPPTCIDGRQNGTESGVDCGGECARACIMDSKEISLLWTRSFRVLPGRYNAVAYLENKNQNIAAQKVNYRFRFADSDNVYIGKREGTTYIPTAGRFAIFEPAVDLGNSVPAYTTFDFTSQPDWITLPGELVKQVNVTVSDIEIADEGVAPKLFANVRNHSLFKIPGLEVVAILYDANGNAISTSSTYLDVLPPETTMPISYTWPEIYEGRAVIKELIPMYDIFLVGLQ